MTGRIPRFLYLPAGFGLAFVTVPILALLVRIDWSIIPQVLASEAAKEALSLSLRTASSATLCCLILGIPLALVIARSKPVIAGVLRAVTTLPLVLPPLVGGIALLSLLGNSGLFGSLLAMFAIRVPFTTAAVIIAQTFVALPFLVISVEAALRTVGTGYETVAATLGAGRWFTFCRVTLPLVLPGIISGTVLSFARALGEFGATALFAGNTVGSTRTMPLAIYTAFNTADGGQELALALSLLLIVLAVAVLLLLRSWRADSR